MRIEPVEPPYSEEVAERLAKMMPPGVEPLLLFRTFVKNLPMANAMGPWGAYELSKKLSLSLRDREVVIVRTCARCTCEYEWGVHIAFFAAHVGLTDDQIRSLTFGGAADSCWESEHDRLLLEVVDSLHEHSHISDGLWARLAQEFSESEILDLTMLIGWYHAICFTANSFEVDLEVAAARFTDFDGPPNHSSNR